MRGKIINKKGKDFIQVAMLVSLLFLYAYSETKRKSKLIHPASSELVLPLSTFPDITAIGGNRPPLSPPSNP